MRQIIIRCLTATTILGGLLFGGVGVAAANPAPMTAAGHMATPVHMDYGDDCLLGILCL
jgi:hypothetical protein